MHLIGINELGAPSPSQGGFLTDAGDLPWLQETDNNSNNLGDIRDDSWNANYRDVVIVDRNSNDIGHYNLTVHDLGQAENFAELKQMFINAGKRTPLTNWQQPVEPLDVDGDSRIGPLDALQVLQFIPSIATTEVYPDGQLPSERPAGEPYLDVNGDSFVSALDALPVIVQLTTRGPISSAVPAAPLSGGASAASVDTLPFVFEVEASSPVSSPVAVPTVENQEGSTASVEAIDQALAEWDAGSTTVVSLADHADAEDQDEAASQFDLPW